MSQQDSDDESPNIVVARKETKTTTMNDTTRRSDNDDNNYNNHDDPSIGLLWGSPSHRSLSSPQLGRPAPTTPTTILSPATQTLNQLSQNCADDLLLLRNKNTNAGVGEKSHFSVLVAAATSAASQMQQHPSQQSTLPPPTIQSVQQWEREGSRKKYCRYRLVATFPTIAQAVRDTGFKRSDIEACILGRRQQVYGCTWIRSNLSPPKGGWVIRQCTISTKSSREKLGLTITNQILHHNHDPIATTTTTTPLVLDHDTTSITPSWPPVQCYVKHVKPSSLAEEGGIQVGDYLYWYDPFTTPSLVASYQRIREAASGNIRPITFWMVRNEGDKKENVVEPVTTTTTTTTRTAAATAVVVEHEAPLTVPGSSITKQSASTEILRSHVDHHPMKGLIPKSNDLSTGANRTVLDGPKLQCRTNMDETNEHKSDVGMMELTKLDEIHQSPRHNKLTLSSRVSKTVTPSTSMRKTQSRKNKRSASPPSPTTYSANLCEQTRKPVPKESEPSLDAKVPFCAICNGRRRRHSVHHTWCPQNPNFHTSGANEILERIRDGVQLGCLVCGEEYRNGRRKLDQPHSRRCQQNQKRRMEEQDDNQSQSSNDENATIGETSELSSRNKELGTDSVTPKLAKVTLPDEHDDSIKEDCTSPCHNWQMDDSESMATDSSPRHVGTTNISKSKEVSLVRKNKTSKARNLVKDKVCLRGKISAREWTVLPRGQQSEAPKKTHENDCRDPSPVHVNWYGSDDLSEIEDDSNDKLDIQWEPCSNPWGHEGFLDDDIVVYTSTPGIGDAECVITSARYEVDPFSKYPRYQLTHNRPEEGFHALVLRRDTLSNSSWGFACHRHEFGGACLVSNVIPLSPANTAILLASSDNRRSPLLPNDMILAVNGKQIGGLTEFAVQVELETEASELLLLVSRFKHSGVTTNNIRNSEAQQLAHLDDKLNDIRRLHWADYGIEMESTNPHAPHTETRAEKGVSLDQDMIVSSPKRGAELACTSGTDGTLDRDAVRQSTVSPAGSIDKCKQKGIDSPGRTITGESDDEYLDTKRSSTKDSNHSVGSHEDTEGIHCDDAEAKMDSIEQDTAADGTHVDEISSKNDGGDEWSDDGNAWCGCVCGDLHQDKKDVFWIQCDCCGSWYNVYNGCVGFDEKEAGLRSKWSCWACEDDATTPNNMSQYSSDRSEQVLDTQNEFTGRSTPSNLHGRNNKTIKDPPNRKSDDSSIRKRKRRDAISCQRKESTEKVQTGVYFSQHGDGKESYHIDGDDESMDDPSWIDRPDRQAVNEDSLSKDSSEVNAQLAGDSTCRRKTYQVGSLVYIKEHGWPGVNNPEGVAWVKKVYSSQKGEVLYDVKYVVGHSSKAVNARFVFENSF